MANVLDRKEPLAVRKGQSAPIYFVVTSCSETGGLFLFFFLQMLIEFGLPSVSLPHKPNMFRDVGALLVFFLFLFCCFFFLVKTGR